MSPIATGLSLMIGDDFRLASAPLFDDDLVDVAEWSFDMGWGRDLPDWLTKIIDDFSRRNQLLGHGVSYSALDASETNRQDIWLHRLQMELTQFQYAHISEHFGFMGGGNFHIAAPLPVPMTEAAITVGHERLRDLSEVAGVPVGLENLAFAFNLNDVRQQGEFLEQLLSPVDGFLLLDLHNLYCQSCNFEVSLSELIDSYPLDRVRELHVSGGSWSEHPSGSGNQIRRDTHDGPVPEEIFGFLPTALQKCKNVEAVILERLDGTIDADKQSDIDQFREDFMRLRKICAENRQ